MRVSRLKRLSGPAAIALVAASLGAAALVAASPAGAVGQSPSPSRSSPGAASVTAGAVAGRFPTIPSLDRELGTSALVSRLAARPGGDGVSLNPGPLPSKRAQIRVLAKALTTMKQLGLRYLGNADVFAYQVGQLWAKGIDGAGTSVAVIEGWDYPGIVAQVQALDKLYNLPDPHLTTVYPAGPLPATCPPGMVALGSYGSCDAWGGELTIDVLAVHLMAPYARIVITATPADTQETDDAASQVAPPELMKAVEYVAARHVANVVSISDGTGESSLSDGKPQILAQDPAELTAAKAGIPVLVATGDCGVVQNLPAASSQCGDTTTTPDTAIWDDSPWVTAVGGSVPAITAAHKLAGPPALWAESCGTGIRCSSAAGHSKIFARPGYQDDVRHRTGSAMRTVPDITMDGTDGTSEAAPLLAGVLALATQQNHGDLGPVNPALYRVLGPAGRAAGIVDVRGGSDFAELPGGAIVPGFTATRGFDVASGWGTVSAPLFVPHLVAASKASHDARAARNQAAAALARLRRAISLSARSAASTGSVGVTGSGFLPGHPVRITVAGHFIANAQASTTGKVSAEISLDGLGLPAGTYRVALAGMLLREATSLRITTS
jgi:hypothetical protein